MRSIKNHLHSSFLILLFFSFTIFQSCEKENIENYSNDNEILVRTNGEPRGQENRGVTSEIEMTVLGIKRNNPFAVSAINIAKAQLYGTSSSPITKTHTYVKFLPTTQEHIATLDTWETTHLIPIFDFPLEYEIIEAGEYYIDPSVSDPLYTYQYTSMLVGTSMPENVPFENIEDLYLENSDPLLLATSFILTGNTHEIDPYINGEHGINPNDLDGGVINSIPTPPDCDQGFVPELTIITTVFPPEFIWNCVEDDSYVGPQTNECGCEIPLNKRMPAGCVKVHDDDGVGVPVRSTTIKTKNDWYTSDFATTDENRRNRAA